MVNSTRNLFLYTSEGNPAEKNEWKKFQFHFFLFHPYNSSLAERKWYCETVVEYEIDLIEDPITIILKIQYSYIKKKTHFEKLFVT